MMYQIYIQNKKNFVKVKQNILVMVEQEGGGKSFVARIKAILLALYYPGIQILLLRRTYGELLENHVLPLQKELRSV